VRILFSAVPASGHVLPLLPLADAAERAGHTVGLLSGRGAAAILPSMDVFEVGPSIFEAIAETGRRLGGDQDGTKPGPGAAELFGAVRLSGVVDEAVEVARRFAPDLIVHDTVDTVGPLIAAVLGVPLTEHRITGPMPKELLQAIADRASAEYSARNVARPAPIAVVDPYPDALLTEAECDDTPGRLPLRPEPHSASGGERPLPEPDGPVAAVTLGTSVQDTAAMKSLVQSIASSEISVLATVEPGTLDVDDSVRHMVHEVGFVPLARLLPGVDVVVSAGGSGTLLAALALGKPQVIRPFIADQPWNARRAADLGIAVQIEDPTSAGVAARQVIDDPSYSRKAEAIARELVNLDDADQVLKIVLARL
jgi:UDP:flavonoid glycosyltransferase YjiC (YdhE family)